METRRHKYFILSFTLSILSLVFCWLIFQSGQFESVKIGSSLLMGVPNYYFFYTIILPFIGTGVMYFAFENKSIRLFGDISDELTADNRSRIERYRLKLLVVALLFSIVVGVEDAREKTTTLPPSSFDLGDGNIEQVARYYACLKGWATCTIEKPVEQEETCDIKILIAPDNGGEPAEQNKDCYLETSKQPDLDAERENENQNATKKNEACYLAIFKREIIAEGDDKGKLAYREEASTCYLEQLNKQGFKATSVSGFESLSQWWEQSSSLYKFESFLSFLAALIVSLLFVQVFLLLMIKDQVRPSTKSLVVWMAVLASLWFPTKMYSSWHFDLGNHAIPATLTFGAAVLVLAILLIVFLKTERNNLYKYAEIAIAILSALITYFSIANPDKIEEFVMKVNIGWAYTGMISFLLLFSLYLVTDHFISNYEQDSTS